MTTPADKARELARWFGEYMYEQCGFVSSESRRYEEALAERIAQALTDAEARRREQGLEEAAKECQCLGAKKRIRALKRKGAGS